MGELGVAAIGTSRRAIVFRYAPVVAVGERRFALYCRAGMPKTAAGEAVAIDLRLRWFAPDDRILVWETARHAVPAQQGWAKLCVDLPVMPRHCAFLRFEILVEDRAGPAARHIGFVQPGPARCDVGDGVVALQAAATPPDAAAALPAEPSAGQMPAPLILPAQRLGNSGTGLLLIRAEPQLGLSSLQFGSWPDAGPGWLAAPVGGSATGRSMLLALPEAGLRTSKTRIIASRTGGRALPAHLRVVGALPARSEPTASPREVAMVVTSCGRQDLLERTLDSFFAHNSYPVARTIVVEDGPAADNAALVDKYAGRNVIWLATERRVGQIAAIDYAYSFVTEPYIFHCEDDWQFYRPGFIEKSLAILQSFPACLQVWIRAINDTNRHPVAAGDEHLADTTFRRLETGYLGEWCGFSFNPGLRRTRDYDRIGRYGWHVAWNRADPDFAERRLSSLFGRLGFYAVILSDAGGVGYVRHLGFGRRVVDRTALTS